MSVGDGVRRACFHAISTKDAAVVVDVVDLGISLRRRDALLFSVLSRLDENAVGWAGRRAQKAGHALLKAILIPLKDMPATEALFKLRPAHRPLAVGIVLNLRGLQHLPEGDAHPLGDGSNIAHNRHTVSIRCMPGGDHPCAAWPSNSSCRWRW